MFTIYVYQLTSPHLPGKAYIGSSKDVAARFQQHKNQRRAAGALFDAGDVALEVLGEFEVETRCEQCRIEGRFQQESALDLLNVRVGYVEWKPTVQGVNDSSSDDDEPLARALTFEDAEGVLPCSQAHSLPR